MQQIEGFSLVLLFIIGGILFLVVTLLIGRIFRPNKPNEEKLSTYESGEVAIKNAWSKFDPKFYIIAIIFLLFEAELVFLFPWSIVWGDPVLIESSHQWGTFALVETFIFIAVLFVGLIYVWKKGMLDWVKPIVKQQNKIKEIPDSVYEKFNSKY